MAATEHKCTNLFFFFSQNFILLFKELPLHLWLLESHDLHVIRNMLTEHPLGSFENFLARVILSGLNWGTKSEVSVLGKKPLIFFCCMLVIMSACGAKDSNFMTILQ